MKVHAVTMGARFAAHRLALYREGRRVRVHTVERAANNPSEWVELEDPLIDRELNSVKEAKRFFASRLRDRTKRGWVEVSPRVHWHRCTECYEAKECRHGCTIEPDLGEGPSAFGSHIFCDDCAREVLRHTVLEDREMDKMMLRALGPELQED